VIDCIAEDDLMVIGDEEPFSEDGEVTVLYEEDALYALRLKNNTQSDLYPYVLFLDPASYTVQIFYEPPSQECPLPSGGELQLGRSVACMQAIFFTLDGENNKDTGFLKVNRLVASRPPITRFLIQRLTD
jgi:hypothetical protein